MGEGLEACVGDVMIDQPVAFSQGKALLKVYVLLLLVRVVQSQLPGKPVLYDKGR